MTRSTKAMSTATAAAAGALCQRWATSQQGREPRAPARLVTDATRNVFPPSPRQAAWQVTDLPREHLVKPGAGNRQVTGVRPISVISVVVKKQISWLTGRKQQTSHRRAPDLRHRRVVVKKQIIRPGAGNRHVTGLRPISVDVILSW